MNARHNRVGAALLAFAASLLMAASASAQGTGHSEDFCSMLGSGELVVTVRVLAHGAEISFRTEGKIAVVQSQVDLLAYRANARFQDGYAPPLDRHDWAFAVPPAVAVVIDTLDGARLFLTSTSVTGDEMIRDWGRRVDAILFTGECSRLLEPAGDV